MQPSLLDLPQSRSWDRHIKVPLTCNECGHEFMGIRRPARAGAPRYCGRVCLSRNNVRRRNALYPQAGAGNGNWKGGVSQHPSRYTKAFKAQNPEKHRAGRLLRHAIRSGRMVRAEACSVCAKVCKTHGHHDDYSKPYDVRWLCQQCHNAHHAEVRRRKAKAA